LLERTTGTKPKPVHIFVNTNTEIASLTNVALSLFSPKIGLVPIVLLCSLFTKVEEGTNRSPPNKLHPRLPLLPSSPKVTKVEEGTNRSPLLSSSPEVTKVECFGNPRLPKQKRVQLGTNRSLPDKLHPRLPLLSLYTRG
ncbi:Hypothetical protein BRZCDTV_100, partial [Brazilian cedratvirus IHUMI]